MIRRNELGFTAALLLASAFTMGATLVQPPDYRPGPGGVIRPNDIQAAPSGCDKCTPHTGYGVFNSYPSQVDLCVNHGVESPFCIHGATYQRMVALRSSDNVGTEPPEFCQAPTERIWDRDCAVTRSVYDLYPSTFTDDRGLTSTCVEYVWVTVGCGASATASGGSGSGGNGGYGSGTGTGNYGVRMDASPAPAALAAAQRSERFVTS